jgi:hypothetical protein
MGGPWEVIVMKTSDALCAQLLASSKHWSLIPLCWEMVCDSPSLLHMSVLGHGE